jgi:hypothetical protein
MMARHLQLIGPSSTLDARAAEIHEAFTMIWGTSPDPLELQHRDELIQLNVSIEAARREFSLRKLRQLRET